MMNFNFQELQRKRSASKKSSRRRRELLQAKEFEEKQQTEQEKTKVSLPISPVKYLDMCNIIHYTKLIVVDTGYILLKSNLYTRHLIYLYTHNRYLINLH